MTNQNIFANCTALETLEFEYLIITSPENISWDGERNPTDTRKAITKYNQQYQERYKQLTQK